MVDVELTRTIAALRSAAQNQLRMLEERDAACMASTAVAASTTDASSPSVHQSQSNKVSRDIVKYFNSRLTCLVAECEY